MAYVAFDLDATLGFFELTNPFAHFWSPNYLENPEQSAVNKRLELSPRLKAKLARVRTTFANSLLRNPHLLDIVLRPNLDAILTQLLAAKKANKLKSVIIYSNTSVTYSMELGKYLIEHKFKSPNLISFMADHWHPLRTADRPGPIVVGKYVQPEKTLKTVQLLFRTASRSTPTADKILFVDDRNPKHKLEEQEKDGLKYIVCKAFYPNFTIEDRDLLLFLALEAIQRGGLLSDTEYLSEFCSRTIPYNYTKRHRVNTFPDLYAYVARRVYAVESSPPWQPDTDSLREEVRSFLKKI